MGFQATSDALNVDGITYTFPLGGATVVVGDTTDISSTFTGACAYSAFTDYMGNCGTGNSVGVGGKGVTASIGYAFDSGFSLAGGVSSVESEIMTKEGSDLYAIEAAYTADTYGVSLTYATVETSTTAEDTWTAINGYWAPEGFPSVSAGYEVGDIGGAAATADEKTSFFLGVQFDEVGPGSLGFAMGTKTPTVENVDEQYMYEVFYSYDVNDGMTITPLVYIKENSTVGTPDETGVIVKTSFSF